MTIVNIRRDVDDKFYRYRMPLLETKIEGKGNGIKTVVPNMSDIARALSRPPSYPTKYFGSELGAQTIIDDKNDRYIVNGDDDDASPYAQFGTWILEEREAGKTPSAAEVYRKAQEMGIEKKHKTLQVLFQALFSENAPTEVQSYGPLLLKMVTSEKHQKSMLGGLERLAGLEHPSLVPNGVPKLLMALYQMDVLDEDVAQQWGTHVSKKYVDKETSKRVRKAAAPFLEWLEQAESDDDDDDEDEDVKKQSGRRAAAQSTSEYQKGDSDLDDL